MHDLNQYTKALNTEFRSGDRVFKLIAADKKIDNDTQFAYSLLFEAEGELIEQCTLKLEHDSLSEIEIFLVPVAQTESGHQYESLFSKLKNNN